MVTLLAALLAGCTAEEPLPDALPDDFPATMTRGFACDGDDLTVGLLDDDGTVRAQLTFADDSTLVFVFTGVGLDGVWTADDDACDDVVTVPTAQRVARTYLKTGGSLTATPATDGVSVVFEAVTLTSDGPDVAHEVLVDATVDVPFASVPAPL